MLEVSDLHTYYGDSHILQGISLKVDRGQVVSVLGRNGVGKTTLIHSIVSFVRPRKGTVMLDGVDIAGKPTHEIMRLGVALVPQGRRVFYSLSVRENLLIPYRCMNPPGNLIKPWTTEDVVETFPLLMNRRDQKAGSLSGGEQQMLAMARALVSGPKLILMDEPSEGLAPLIVKEISNVILRLAKSGVAILLVEQNFNMAMRLADHVYVMSRGGVVFQSTPEELVGNEAIKARYLGM